VPIGIAFAAQLSRSKREFVPLVGALTDSLSTDGGIDPHQVCKDHRPLMPIKDEDELMCMIQRKS